MTSAEPGVVYMKRRATGPEESRNLIKSMPTLDDLPQVVQPPGLNQARQQYLFEKIRPYVPMELKNVVCPKPKMEDAGTNLHSGEGLLNRRKRSGAHFGNEG